MNSWALTSPNANQREQKILAKLFAPWIIRIYSYNGAEQSAPKKFHKVLVRSIEQL